jgi:hypothetical protein
VFHVIVDASSSSLRLYSEMSLGICVEASKHNRSNEDDANSCCAIRKGPQEDGGIPKGRA